MAQATYRDIGGPSGLLARCQPFEGNSMSAYWSDGVYYVLSYSTCIAEWRPDEDGGTLHVTDYIYSPTSARHLSLASAWTARYDRQHEVVWSRPNRGYSYLIDAA